MAELLLVDATNGTNSMTDQLSRWATDLHDQLDAQGCVTSADRRRLTSWLRVQAVGRATVTVTESRARTYAGVWAEAARSAGLTVRLTSPTGEPLDPGSLQPSLEESTDETGALVAPAGDLSRATTGGVDDRWRTRSRIWLLDRAEAAGRIAVRTIQR